MIISDPSTRPWYESSLMFDATTTGGIGLSAPVFRHYGPPGDALSGMPKSAGSKKAIATAALVGGSVVGGLLGYGLYGHLRDKGWNTWKAGAMVGLTGGLGGLLCLEAVGRLTGREYIG